MRADDRENFAKMSPVATAVTMRLVTDSATMIALAPALVGYIQP